MKIDLDLRAADEADAIEKLRPLGYRRDDGAGETWPDKGDGFDLDVIGPVVDQAAVFADGDEPGSIVLVAPATFKPGFHLNLRLTGPGAEARANAVRETGLVLDPPPANPVRRWQDA